MGDEAAVGVGTEDTADGGLLVCGPIGSGGLLDGGLLVGKEAHLGQGVALDVTPAMAASDQAGDGLAPPGPPTASVFAKSRAMPGAVWVKKSAFTSTAEANTANTSIADPACSFS
ncbi:hypothetical protein GKIL_0907 [Gloeobacter kilaueensis JS1]|uniref:Uncharacterized protein n=1 Tax=Gloeobacter kilaueensis (strain ATCC BAA-2537 / CCAP 1431/1 / ULC 316 / JS1) TaxID=1183438 RepID=U5QE51_GLOK1|nr:hypothetical protein GKIL_0907 [Gloeobacter kilaueensis JS1]